MNITLPMEHSAEQIQIDVIATIWLPLQSSNSRHGLRNNKMTTHWHMFAAKFKHYFMIKFWQISIYSVKQLSVDAIWIASIFTSSLRPMILRLLKCIAPPKKWLWKYAFSKFNIPKEVVQMIWIPSTLTSHLKNRSMVTCQPLCGPNFLSFLLLLKQKIILFVHVLTRAMHTLNDYQTSGKSICFLRRKRKFPNILYFIVCKNEVAIYSSKEGTFKVLYHDNHN